MIKLSVITINYNNAVGLEKTIESVISQNFKEYEYIVIDGGSNDGSKEIIESFTNKISYWVSEKDKGIYNAMNKGIQQAKGEYCLFLNSGDFLYNNKVLEEVFTINSTADIIYGNMLIDWGNGKKTEGKMPDAITVQQMYKDTLWHPVSFIKRILFEKYGLYNEDYKMVADYDFFFKTIIANKISTKQIPLLISEYNVDGFSSKPENKIIEQEERKRVIHSYLSQEEINYLEDIAQKEKQKKCNPIKSLFKKWF
jgi:glycosyltransferase involved in cell wall biosynthesis